MLGLAYRIAKSDTPTGRVVRRLRATLMHLGLPLSPALMRPVTTIFVVVRSVYWWIRRVFFVEPIFRGYLTSVGQRFKTGIYLHFVHGRGRFVVGDDVRIDGKSSFMFARGVDALPELVIGDRTHIGHDCHFTIARSVRIGSGTLFASGVRVMDTNAHPVDAIRRLAGEHVRPDEIRPVEIGSNVWIGANAMILPGVRIGDDAVVAAHAVVNKDVPDGGVVGGVPARVIGTSRRQS